ncbi:syntaxin-binding protein 6 isoform X3 [Petromyzon marinus]|uniref:Syntaxin-binding protein 6-like isoform X3 n=1 Tax=Petromyzon marinus TaxID=7757 RepID=A0AAJ7SSU9_PETMA|nr:syntaxin-binding protein 6-like isoform X3 [Petromyzon marinus]
MQVRAEEGPVLASDVTTYFSCPSTNTKCHSSACRSPAARYCAVRGHFLGGSAEQDGLPCATRACHRMGRHGGELLTTSPVTNKKPLQGYITKVKRFEGVSSFVRRSQWTLDQLRQVNGVDGIRDCPEFDLLFDNAHDQWVAGTAAEKGSFLQSLHHTCQRHLAQRLQPDFLNCPSRILVGNSILCTAADSVTSAVQKASQALNERGERLGRAEDKTADMANSANQFAETAQKLVTKYKC